MKITKTTQETERFITNFIDENGRKPKMKDIMERFNLNSTASAWERVNRVEQLNETCPYCGKEL